MNSNFNMKGTLQIYKNGELLQEVPNLIVTSGKVWAANMLTAGTGTVMSHMAVGSNSTTPTLTDTTLNTEITRVTLQTAGGSVSGSTITFTAVFGAGIGTGTWAEAGVFNAASAGTMFNRATFSSFTKGAGDQVTIVWTVTQP